MSTSTTNWQPSVCVGVGVCVCVCVRVCACFISLLHYLVRCSVVRATISEKKKKISFTRSTV